MKNDLHVAVVGCGHISDTHVEAWKRVGAKIVAVCDKNISVAESKSKKWGVSKYYGNVSQMIEEENLDVVSVCTPAHIRSEVVIPFIQNGINVVIEKPLALSVAEAEKMVDIQQKHRVKLTVVHNWLFSHVMKKTLNILKKKEIGDVLGAEIEALNTPKDDMTSNPSNWCHSLIGGRFAEMLPHPLYLLQAILGEGELKIRSILGSKLGNYDWMPIDELRVLLEDSKGRTASIYATFNTVRTETTIKVYGAKGILDVNLSSHILIKKRYREIKIGQVMKDNLKFLSDFVNSSFSIASTILTRRYQSMHTTFIKEFVHSIANNTEPPVTPKEALQVTKTWEELCSKLHSYYPLKNNSVS
ncbi:MAG: Gfo/Idh/MocA family protein [Candidatus Jordarchaeum sp.]|uniref:Gfo/Idh/MocA family protein n=1 Tax=Candidatus Jordarchaeum sp. TaxID=2823881 RepID=UPI00404A5296